MVKMVQLWTVDSPKWRWTTTTSLLYRLPWWTWIEDPQNKGKWMELFGAWTNLSSTDLFDEVQEVWLQSLQRLLWISEGQHYETELQDDSDEGAEADDEDIDGLWDRGNPFERNAGGRDRRRCEQSGKENLALTKKFKGLKMSEGQ